MSETRKLAAILAADVVGFSRLTGADEDRTLARLRALRSDLIDPTISVHKGRVVKRTGDGAIVEFRSVVDAVRCAVEIQHAMADRNAGVPEDRRIVFRIGVHLGDVVEESDGDLMGDGVNIAARLEGVAYDSFLRGRELWWRHAKESNRDAERLLRRTIELDPRFGPAYAFLAAAKVNDYASGWSASPEQGLAEAETAARLAVQLDERYPFALWALAGACLWARRHDDAVSAAEKVVGFNPSFAEGYGMLGFALHYVGRSEEAAASIDRAMALDPFCSDMVLHFKAQAVYQLGRYAEAAGLLQRRILRNPETDASRALLAAAYGQMGLIEQARESWRALARQPELFHRATPQGVALQEPERFRPVRRGLAQGGAARAMTNAQKIAAIPAANILDCS
jgi:hypothetical protein